MNIIVFTGFLILTLFLFFSINMSVYAGSEQENVILKMSRELEEWNIKRLSAVQSDPKSNLREFETDGCSGGLSDAWLGFGKILPQFQQHFGNRPPWELCCVNHDRAYWQGVTENGFSKRLQADQELKQCVYDYGTENSKRLAAKFNLSEDKIVSQFKLTSILMYRAVRLGGKPCSYLPWRWGYGWPHCALSQEQD